MGEEDEHPSKKKENENKRFWEKINTDLVKMMMEKEMLNENGIFFFHFIF
jgi:hypothetical protein